jgi:hypothetical protein
VTRSLRPSGRPRRTSSSSTSRCPGEPVSRRRGSCCPSTPAPGSSCSRVTRPRPRSGRRRRSACPATSSREDPAELVDYVRTVAAGGTAWSQAVFRTGDGETGGSPSQNHRPSCGERRHGLGAALNTTNQVLAVVGLAAVLCPLADAAIRRQAEFVADRFAADHGLALELAAALRAMDDGQRVACGWSRRLLASHPTADRRISALLTAMAPRQPDPGAIRLA